MICQNTDITVEQFVVIQKNSKTFIHLNYGNSYHSLCNHPGIHTTVIIRDSSNYFYCYPSYGEFAYGEDVFHYACSVVLPNSKYDLNDVISSFTVSVHQHDKMIMKNNSFVVDSSPIISLPTIFIQGETGVSGGLFFEEYSFQFYCENTPSIRGYIDGKAFKGLYNFLYHLNLVIILLSFLNLISFEWTITSFLFPFHLIIMVQSHSLLMLMLR